MSVCPSVCMPIDCEWRILMIRMQNYHHNTTFRIPLWIIYYIKVNEWCTCTFSDPSVCLLTHFSFSVRIWIELIIYLEKIQIWNMKTDSAPYNCRSCEILWCVAKMEKVQCFLCICNKNVISLLQYVLLMYNKR